MKFKCTGCGACCGPNWAGDYQIITISDSEIVAASEYLGMSIDELLSAYKIIGNHINTSSAMCPFLLDNKCIIHAVKPSGCAKWPWINMANSPSGREIMASRCKGITLQGEDDGI